MSLYEACRKRATKGEENSKDRKIWQLRDTFDKYLQQSPTGVTIKFTHPDEFPILKDMHDELVIINDILANDKKSNDEKLVKARYDTMLDVGCYFYMDNSWWVIVWKDRKEMDTKKTFTAKLCNQFIRYKYKNEIYDIPVVMQDDTNSDGLQQVKYGTSVDTRRTITYGANCITKTIPLGQRFVIRNKDVYSVTRFNDFEYNGMFTGSDGVITASITEVLLNSKDDLDGNIAYNKEQENNSKTNRSGIKGDEFIYIGEKKTYEFGIPRIENIEWKVECVENLISLESDNKICILKCKLDMSCIGEEIKLYVIDKDTNNEYMKIIKVRGL